VERLDKRLSGTGRWSRKEARELIRAGRVTVDEAVCRAPEQKVTDEQPVRVDGQRLDETGPVYLMLHKPAGVVSATEDSRERTVLSLLPEPYRRLGLFPVGRLDKDTEGLLLLTDDGALAHRLLSPKNHVDKVYYLEVDGVLDETDVQAAEKGITLADGYTCLPARLEPLPGGRAGRITIHEGKYHQVKRMMAARGKPVTYLRRVEFGPLKLDPNLAKSCWRPLSEEEKELLFRH
jgi:16S rRNA pseudouridine516 synthase